jgi:hypothetical protein
MTESQHPEPDDTQERPEAPEPEQTEAPEDEPAEGTGDDEPQVGRRPDFIEEASEE